MLRGKDKINKEKLLKQKVIFCTQCGVELENYCFNKSSDDIEAIKMNLAQCKKTGRFAGDFCSKLFIADDKNLEILFLSDEE
jgi:hypothetical protein